MPKKVVRNTLLVLGNIIMWPSLALLWFGPLNSFRYFGLYAVVGVIVGFVLAAIGSIEIHREGRGRSDD